MPELGPIKTGVDTWVAQANPTANHGDSRYLQAQSGNARILLAMPLAIPAGAVILEATLSARARLDLAAQTWTVQSLSAKWTPKSARWATPGVTGPTTSVAIGATAAGARFSIDVTDLVQLVADGAPNYGWRISTNHSSSRQRLYAFDSGAPAWELRVSYSVPAQVPTGLSPEGVVGIAKWVCSVDGVDDLAAIRVQVDADATGSPDFDSGWVSTTLPTLDLATTAYAGLADGASTWWRAATRTTDGGESGWSDWVQVTRHVKPTLVMDNPVGAYVSSPTATIAAHLTPAGDEDAIWNVVIRDAATGQRYNSSLIGGAELALTLPLKWGGQTVLPHDGPYTLQVRAQDRRDRVASPGDPTYVEELIEFTVGTDPEAAIPTMVWAHQEGESPNVRLRWTTGAADLEGFFIFRDGVAVAWLDDPDVLEVADYTYEWVDVEASPNTTHAYAAVSQYDGGWSARSGEVEATAVVEGVWLQSRYGQVCLYGTDIGGFKQRDKRETYDLPYSPNVVSIITAIGGFSGGFSGDIDSRQDVAAARVVLEEIRQHPETPVRLSWGTAGAWVYLESLSVAPAPEMLHGNDWHTVSWEGMTETTDEDPDVLDGLPEGA